MKNMLLVSFLSLIIGNMSFKNFSETDTLTGAWHLQSGDQEQVLLFVDGYFTHSLFNKAFKEFIQTRGGTFTIKENKLEVTYEFDTKNKESVGTSIIYNLNRKNGSLISNVDGEEKAWQIIDNGTGNLSGLWKISARQQEGKLVPIHQTGTRKTIKILTGSRFQWAAIDPATKEFMGTGGGTYTFSEGKYTEHIEFFSRDNNRVGSKLTFEGKVENGDWHHSGLSSRGDAIYEVWSRKK